MRWPLRLILAAILIFVTYTGLRAISEAFDSSSFPESLAVKVDMLPIIFPLHMITGGLALLLVPASILMRGTAWHKFLGRVTASDILVAGITAPFVAWAAPVTFGSAAGFTAQTGTWLTLLVAGIWNIRHGNRRAHQTCMVLMAAVTSGALFFRIFLALWVHTFGSRIHFYDFYAVSAWIAWMLPLAIVAAFAYDRASQC